MLTKWKGEMCWIWKEKDEQGGQPQGEWRWQGWQCDRGGMMHLVGIGDYKGECGQCRRLRKMRVGRDLA